MTNKACYKANKYLVGKTFLILFTFTMILINIYSRVQSMTLIPMRFRAEDVSYFRDSILVPTKLFVILDVIVLSMLILLIIYSIGVDFDHRMDELTLTMSEKKYNSYLLGKIIHLLKIYIPLYAITYFNMYMIIKSVSRGANILSLPKCLYISFTSQFFVISLTLFVIFLIRNVRGILATLGAYFVFVEFILGHNILRGMGVYSHFFIYDENFINNIMNNRFIYNILSVILLYLAIILSGKGRKVKMSTN